MIGGMQNLEMLQAALQAATPEVTQPQQIQGPQQAGQQQGPGNRNAQIGNAVGGLVGMFTPKGKGQTQQMVETDTLGFTEPLSQALMDAGMDYEADKRRYQQSQTQRFRPGSIMGIGESLYDMFRGKKVHKDMLESRQVLQNEALAYEKKKEDMELAKEMEERKNYVETIMPLLQYTNPNMDPQALQSMALIAAQQKTPIDKFMKDAPMPMIRDEIREDGRYEVMINPLTNLQVPGSEARLVEGPAEEKLRYVQQTNELGAVNELALDKNGEMVRSIQLKPPGSEKGGRDYSALPGTDRQRLGLVSAAAHNLESTIDYLMRSDGSMANWGPFFDWKGPGSVALRDLDQAVYSMLRNETGAQIADSEVKKDAKLYVPQFGDSEVVARGKLARLANRINVTHGALTGGLNNLPGVIAISDFSNIPGLKIRDYPDTVWDGTVTPLGEQPQTSPEQNAVGTQTQIAIDNEMTADAELEARYQAAIKAAGG